MYFMKPILQIDENLLETSWKNLVLTLRNFLPPQLLAIRPTAPSLEENKHGKLDGHNRYTAYLLTALLLVDAASALSLVRIPRISEAFYINSRQVSLYI